MAFKKGDPRPPGSGRKKATGNHPKTLRKGLADRGFDITQQFLDLLAVTTDPKDRLQILKTIAQYTQVAPKEELPEATDTAEDKEEAASFLQLLKDQ